MFAFKTFYKLRRFQTRVESSSTNKKTSWWPFVSSEDRILQELTSMNQKLGKLDDKVSVLSSELGKLDEKVQKLDDKVQKLDDKVQKLDDKVQKLDDKVSVLSSELGKTFESTTRSTLERTHNIAFAQSYKIYDIKTLLDMLQTIYCSTLEFDRDMLYVAKFMMVCSSIAKT
jgi:X-X-X-Leu-X-X-Gly heptad repeat protein